MSSAALRSVGSTAGRRLPIDLNKRKPLAFQIHTRTSSGGGNLPSLGEGADSEKPKGPNGKLNSVKYLRLPTSSPPLWFPPKLSRSNSPSCPIFLFLDFSESFLLFHLRAPLPPVCLLSHASLHPRLQNPLKLTSEGLFLSFGYFKPCQIWQLSLFVAV